jgi:DNA helicase-2/ATP-dependent DNA helicase PcrA
LDLFEPVRAAAAELHQQLVEKGADADDPLALVEAAVGRFELELVWLDPDSPALKGARALFDEQTGTICASRANARAERAQLIAHEVGHVVVHASSTTCSDHDIDPSRSTEPAPVGLQRVEDYGVRERRELQANVFAREFLLPRSRARALFLGGKTASAIAAQLDLGLDLVRQQLLDALLLPAAPDEAGSAPAQGPTRPDPSQDRAAAHRGAPFQLQAGPGTGKTRTLIKRILSLLAENVDPATILVLTFSNRAAGELAERLARAAPEAAARVWIGTFHAFGLDLVRRYHDRLDLPSDPVLFDRSDAIEVLEELLPTLPLVHYRNLWDPVMVLRDVLSAVSRAKDELVDPIQYRTLAQAMLAAAGADDAAREAAEKALEVARIYEVYDAALRERRAVDFGDLIMRPVRLLDGDAAIRTTLQLRHRHVLVDEYQDINRASARLVQAVAGDGARLWVVGDARQSIYRFRGASAANMAAFASDYPAAVIDRLSVNYRSSREVIDTFEDIAPRMGASAGMLALKLEADAGARGVKAQLSRFDSPEDEAAGVAASVKGLETAGIRLRDQAVLCRTNSQLNDLAAALEARDIPVLHLGSLFERPEIRDLLSFLSLAVDPFGNGLVRVGAMARYAVPLEDLRRAVTALKGTEGAAIRKLRQAAATPGLSAVGTTGLQRLADDIAGLPSTSPWALLTTYLLDRTDRLGDLARSSRVSDKMAGVAIWQFMNFVRDRSPVGQGAPIHRLLERVRQLVLLAEERDLRQIPAGALHMDAVRLMTVHGSKGLEFEAVHIPGLTVASFPSSNRGQRCPAPTGMIDGERDLAPKEAAKRSHEHEEECLFFVAASRARTQLRLYHARKQANGNNRTPSPFLGWIAPGHLSEIAAPALTTLPRAIRKPAVDITWPADWRLTEPQLIAYLKCPRRFFYTHVLGLGGRRKTTAFGQAHDCIYEIIAYVGAKRIDGPLDADAAALEFERIWSARGPAEHAFAAEYRALADHLVERLIRSGDGRQFRKPEPIVVTFSAGAVLVEPSEVIELANGAIILRRVRTGHRRTTEYDDDLVYTLYHLAGDAAFPGAYSVEALHLTDGTLEAAQLTPAKLATRREKSRAAVAAIRQGDFPIEVDSVTCSRCPHFFICDALPLGPLDLRTGV